MNNLTVHRGFEPGMAIMLLAAVATPAQMEQQKFAQSQQQNAQALRQYTWKSRREVRKSGEIRNVQLALMRYDIYGRCRDSALEHTAAAAADARPARSRGLIAQKKKENFMETLESGALAGYYKRASTGRNATLHDNRDRVAGNGPAAKVVSHHWQQCSPAGRCNDFLG